MTGYIFLHCSCFHPAAAVDSVWNDRGCCCCCCCWCCFGQSGRLSGIRRRCRGRLGVRAGLDSRIGGFSWAWVSVSDLENLVFFVGVLKLGEEAIWYK